jgi:hypothetical protein
MNAAKSSALPLGNDSSGGSESRRDSGHAATTTTFAALGRRCRRMSAAAKACCCIAILTGLVLPAAFPAPSHAFAWVDKCSSIAANTGFARIRVALWTPFPPFPGTSPVALATYTAVGITQGQIGLALTHTGTPVTYGCHGTVTYTGPPSPVTCTYNAPTKGGNSYQCNGLQGSLIQLKYFDLGDDIYGKMIFGGGNPFGSRDSVSVRASASAASGGTPPLLPKGQALQASDLRGKGWTPATSFSKLKITGRLWDRGKLSASCNDKRKSLEPRPAGTRASLFLRDRGAESAGALVDMFGSSTAAVQARNDATSRHSIGCLRQLLTSVPLHESTTAARLVTHVVGMTGWRLTIRSTLGHKRIAAVVDVASAARGRKWALGILSQTRTPTATNVETFALAALSRKIG